MLHLFLAVSYIYNVRDIEKVHNDICKRVLGGTSNYMYMYRPRTVIL